MFFWMHFWTSFGVVFDLLFGSHFGVSGTCLGSHFGRSQRWFLSTPTSLLKDFTCPKKSIKNEVPRRKKTPFRHPKMVAFWPHFWSIFGGAFRGHMAASLPSFGRPKRSKVLILAVRGPQNCPPKKAPPDTSKASLLGYSWDAQAASWGPKRAP